MAVYIEIRKDCAIKDNSSVIYLFSLTDGRQGRFKINMSTGDTELIEPMPHDDGSLYARAAHKIRKSWQEGDLPDQTCWAS